MVADLFSIDRTAIDETLESFSQNGIKGLIDIEVEYTGSEGKGHTSLKPPYSSHSTCASLFLQYIRRHRQGFTQSLEIRVTIEYFNGKRDIEYSLA